MEILNKDVIMKFNILAAILFSGIVATPLFMSGCTAPDATTPSLQGNTQYPGALPSPVRNQKNAAIDASTMIPPR